MAFVLLIHSETLGVKVNNPTCNLKCSDWNTLNCYILYINYPILQATFQTESSRGCQVIATKNMRLFCQENGLKPHISV